MPRKHARNATTTKRLRLLLARLVRECPDARATVEEIRKLVLQAALAVDGPAANDYRVEKRSQGEVLSEHRASRSGAPFRVPKSIHDASVVVLAQADRPLDFEELVHLVGGKLGVAVPSFQLRVLTRFWLSLENPFLMRIRSRYRAKDVKTFKSNAEKAWRVAARPRD
jgi:hypothetical protein